MTDSIREALTAAIDKDFSADAEATPPAADETITPDPVDSGAPPSGDGADEGSDHDAQETPPAAAADPATPAAPAPVATPETPAPASWSTEERAAWSTVPEAARKAIMRRETETNNALRHSVEARRRVEKLEKLAEPYKPLLDSYGIKVEEAMPGLLATRAVLEVGTPEQKALMLANVCADFGIDLNLLDGALTQRYANGVPAQRYNSPPKLDLRNHPDLQPLYAIAERLNEANQTKAAELVATVQSQPHYDAVRFTMADLIDQAKANGRNLDLSNAYRFACELHGLAAPPPPAAAQSVSDAARTLAAARNAAASVSGAPKPSAPRKPGEGSIADEIAANLAAASGRRR